VGYPPLGTGIEIWSNPELIREVTCGKLMIGHRLLLEYYDDLVDRSYESSIWWRDTTPSQYQLHKSNLPLIYSFRDGFDNGTSTYPNFVGISIGLVWFEVGYLVDVHGYKYLAISAGEGYMGGIGYMEGYLCDWSILSWRCNGGIPSASEIQKAVSGICGGFEVVILTGVNLGTLCKDWSVTNWDLTSSVLTFYAGVEAGAGVGVTATIPLARFGVPPNPHEGWAELINARRQHGMTWAKISSEGLWR
jgi:hypothetical protein